MFKDLCADNWGGFGGKLGEMLGEGPERHSSTVETLFVYNENISLQQNTVTFH